MSCPKQSSLYKTRDRKRTGEPVWYRWPETNRYARWRGRRGEERRWTPLKLWLEEERKSAVTKGDRWEGAFAYETATWEKHRGTFDSVVFKCNIKMPQRAHARSYPLCKVTSSCFESPSRGKSRCSAAFVATPLSSYFEAFIKWMRREAFEKTKNTTQHNTMA